MAIVSELYKRELFWRSSLPAKVSSSRETLQRLHLQHKLEGHEGCVNAVSFNSSGSLLMSGSDDLNLIIWDWERGMYLHEVDL